MRELPLEENGGTGEMTLCGTLSDIVIELNGLFLILLFVTSIYQVFVFVVMRRCMEFG